MNDISIALPAAARHRRCHLVWLLLALLFMLGACAVRGPRPAAALDAAALADEQARQIVGEWQRRLAAYISTDGRADPAALTRLPALRATGTLRPGRITFGALDVDASVAEDDGFDVQGLLLGPSAAHGADDYLFVVGIVQRRGYRPVAIADIRLVAMTVRNGQLDWAVGEADEQALARYRAAVDLSEPLRFPADQDRFEALPCAPGLCAHELHSQARWRLSRSSTAQAASSP
jgi:hypothetical protein